MKDKDSNHRGKVERLLFLLLLMNFFFYYLGSNDLIFLLWKGLFGILMYSTKLIHRLHFITEISTDYALPVSIL